MFIVDRVLNGDEKPSSPAKSDTLKSTDSASGGDTLDDRSSKEVKNTIYNKHLLIIFIYLYYNYSYFIFMNCKPEIKIL
jgi:hypothetical protein